MFRKQRVVAVAVLLAVLSTVGCAGGGSGSANTSGGGTSTSGGGGGGSSGTGNPATAPVISNLTYPGPMTANSDGTVTVSGSINFTATGSLAALNVTVLDASGQQLSAFSNPITGLGSQTSGTLSASFVVTVNGLGTCTFRISVTDVNGSKSNELTDTIQANYSVPVLTSITPTSMLVNSGNTQVRVSGHGFTALSTMKVNNSSPIGIDTGNSTLAFFTIPAAYLTALGPLSITVSNPGTAASNALPVNVTPNPVPGVSSLSPTGTAFGGSDFTLTVTGSGFVSNSVVQWNGAPRSTTFVSSNQLKATISAKDIQTLGNSSVSVFTPLPGGGTTAALPFATFISLPANDLTYSPFTQLLYASVPSSGGSSLGNSIVPIDPDTGVMGTPIFVGSEPTKMAMSSDGKMIWVALQGAAAVRNVDLVAQTAGLQFSLGGGTGYLNPPNTAQALAVMPGSPNTVAVAAPVGFAAIAVTIYDSGVPRANVQSSAVQCCPMYGFAFDPTGTTLYEVGSGYGKATIDSTGIASFTILNNNVSSNALRVDNGRAYLNNGLVLNADTGVLTGTFFAAPGQNANGPEAPDSTVGRSFVLLTSSAAPNLQVNAYDTSTFLLTGSPLIAAAASNNAESLVRWGQDGLAFSNGMQVFIFHTVLVRNISSSLADLSVTANAATVATTGTNITYTLTVNNDGPLVATPATLIDDIPNGASFQSVTSSQGNCSGGAIVYCDLGNMNSGSSATVQITVTLLTPGTLSNTALVSAPQGDPNPANNIVASATAVTGAAYSSAPVMSSISPALVQTGSPSFILTVNGSGFVSGSVVQWNSTQLSTTYVSATQLTANVSASSVASLGWGWVSVANPAPGGGNSLSLPLTTFQAVSLDVNSFVFDPFTRKLYATIPSTATQVAGNSLIGIDPASGSLGTPLNIGSQPNRIAESSDGKYVYVGLDGSKSITNVDLTSMQQGPVFPITVPPFATQVAATDLAVAPGNDNLLAINVDSNNGLFDFAATSGTMRPNLTGSYTGSTLAFANGTTFYSYSTDSVGGEFYRWTVTSAGPGLASGDTGGYTLNGFGNSGFKVANNLIYGFGGGVVNPTTTPPTQLGQVPVAYALGSSQTISGTGVAPDPTIGRTFVLGETFAGSNNSVLVSYDSSKYVTIGVKQFTGSLPGVDLVRWGRDGLAWHSLAGNAFGAAAPGKGQIILVRGPFVLPEWNTSNPTPALSSASPASANAGSSNLMLTLTGLGFVPGALVMWNGTERTTTLVDSTHLTVAIPASDLSQTGAATLTVNNPGSSDSNSISFSIN